MNYTTDRDFALTADKDDVLQIFRHKFHIPVINGRECVYFCGNSLGLQPKSTGEYIRRELDKWAQSGVEGHFASPNPWLQYHKFVQKQLAEVVGARPAEVAAANSLTVNLHLLFRTFYQPAGKKTKILVEENPFSSDWYALQSQVRLHGLDPKQCIIELQSDDDSQYLSTESILRTIDRHHDELAMVFLGGVNYLSGQAFDMATIIRHAHQYGIIVGLDLAHAAGNLELKLHDWEADFAVWCSYKYLNSGPGSTGGYFIHERHAANKNLPRLAGWWGHEEETRFRMGKEFVPAGSADGWQLSNAPVLALAAQWASLDIFQEAGMSRLRQKSILLTGYLEFLLHKMVLNTANPFGIRIITPANPRERGCQLSLKIGRNGQELYQELCQNGYIVDFRNPDIIRVSPTPLYNRFSEVYSFVHFLKDLS